MTKPVPGAKRGRPPGKVKINPNIVQRPKPEPPPAPPPKRGRGRPPGVGAKPINQSAIEVAAAIGCTEAEIAALQGMSMTSFWRKMQADPSIAEAIRQGRQNGRASLRRKQWEIAQKGNVQMLIWLGKNMLDQRDRSENTMLTAEEIKRVADLARSEASRRGYDLDATAGPDPGALPN